MNKETQLREQLRPAFRLLYFTFGIVPIVAGLDKYTNFLTDWGKYLNHDIVQKLPLKVDNFMLIIGALEVVAGVLVLLRPAIGGLIVAFWLVCIALSLISDGTHFDVAVRDLVIAISAFVMARFAKALD